MIQRNVGVDELWDMVIGGSALATGGGGVGPTREQFDTQMEPVLRGRICPALVETFDIPEDELVFMGAGVGGGVRRGEKERWLANPGPAARSRPDYDQAAWINSQLDELEWLFPSCPWSERPSSDVIDAAERRLQELVGKGSVAYIPFEIGPRVYAILLRAATKGKPVVDADTAGYRAVPEVSLSSLNVAEAPLAPVVLASAWGDLLTLEKVLNWQRFEDICRQVAVSCGGGVSGMAAFSGSCIAGGAVRGSVTKAMKIGAAIREAVAAQRDPADAAARAAGGRVLFRGKVVAQLNEEKGAFIWGEDVFKGPATLLATPFEFGTRTRII